MTTTTLSPEAKSQNPFRSQGSYSPAGVELMRALSVLRKETGRNSSTPLQIVQSVADLGYQQPTNSTLPIDLELRRFTRAMSQYQQENNIAYPTCEDVLSILDWLGYHRHLDDQATISDGLPIDRRRKEEDDRNTPAERRSSLDPSPQELLDLTEEEHQFLDALKNLRSNSGREFAASEELLSIVWDLGYRPLGTDGVPMHELTDAERCEIQIAFTRAIEERVSATQDREFLTCRSIFGVVRSVGFEKAC